MADDTWVPPRWHYKNAPDQLRPTPVKVKPKRQKKIIEQPVEPVVEEPVEMPVTETQKAEIKTSSDAAMALLSEYGLAGSNMRKNP